MKLSRILVTNTEAEYPKQLVQTLVSHNDLIVYVIAKNFEELTRLMTEYKNVLTLIPLLLDTSKNETESRQLVKHLPQMNAIVNFSGGTFLEKFSKRAYKVEDVNIHTHSKTEKVLNKLLTAGKPKNGEQGQSVLINIIYDEELGIPQSPVIQRQTATVVARQVTSSLRSSFRKLFKKTSSPPALGQESLPSASSCSSASPRRAMTLPSSASPPAAQAHSNLAYFLNTSDFKLCKKLNKLFIDYKKKWKSKQKDFKSWEKKESKLLAQNMVKYRKEEETLLRQSNANATSAAMSSPNNVISSNTVNEMRARREDWAKKKIDRKVEQKFKSDQANLEATIEKERKAIVEKFYQKLFTKQIEVLEKYVIITM